MFLRRTILRRTSIALLSTFIGTSCVSSANACWLTDWLYGRPQGAYAVGYAPVDASIPTSSYRLPVIQPASPILGGSSSAYALQRPAYLDNPSVYTGRPVIGSAVAPVLAFRGANTTSNAYYGTGNQYPNTSAMGWSNLPPATAARVNYQAPLVPSVNSGAAGVIPVPPSALPTNTSVPLYVTPPPRRTGGLARFFGSLLGTNYRSSYYRAPVTYYRPATGVDPLTGTTVTVQQPCTSYSQQLQRTPYSSFQAAPTSPSYADSCSSAPTLGFNDGPSTFSVPTQGTIGQVGGYGGSLNVTPIPATGNSMPLTGAPQQGFSNTPLPGAAAGDLQAMEPPSLSAPADRINQRPTTGPEVRPLGQGSLDSLSLPSDGIPADGQWRLKSSSDPDSSRRLDLPTTALPNADQASLQAPARFGAVRPVPAPAEYRNPLYSDRTANSNRVERARKDPSLDNYPSLGSEAALPPLGSDDTLQAPPLNRSRYENNFTSRPTRQPETQPQRLSVPVREASMESSQRRRSVRHIHEPVESNWQVKPKTNWQRDR